MSAAELAWADIDTVARRLRSGELTSVALTEMLIDRIDAHEPALNAFITRTSEAALHAAAGADADLSAGHERGPLHGVPLVVKDLFAMRGLRNTFGTLLFADHVSATDATVVRRLQEAGAVILGKTNLHEFATGTTSANPHFGPVRNPWNHDCHAGGSSGGTAAAVAAGLAYGGLGTDTGCSIRQPAHMCNLVGLKPTFGRVSRHGGWVLSWSMDHAGPITRTVRDCAIMLQVLAGHDPLEASSSPRPVDDYLVALEDGIRGNRIGVPQDYFLENCEAGVAAGFEAALQVLGDLGASVEPVELPDMNAARAAGQTLITTEFHTLYHEQARQRPEAFSDANRAYVGLGALFSAQHVLQAQRLRRLVTEQTIAAMAGLDAIVMPTCPVVTAPIAGLTGSESLLHTQNTVPFDAISLPALSVPAGFDGQGLPFGLQIVGHAFDEVGVLRIGHAFEQATRYFERRPAGY